MNYYPFHIGDYVSATRHLSWDEDTAFRRLLDTYYTTEKPIPADIRQAWRLVMAQTDSQREAVQTVLDEFFELTDAGWLNKRAEVEIAAMKDKQQKQRDKANKRWGTAKQDNPAMPRHEKADATASKVDADAMPPTPTPTPTPTPKERVETRRASRLPPDWTLPAEWRAWSKAARPDLDPAKVADRFRDFWISKAGKDGAKLDWAATWRNWVRAEAAMNGRNNGPSPGAGDIWAGAV